MDKTEEKKSSRKKEKFSVGLDITLDDRLDLLDIRTHEILSKLEGMDKHYEHAYASMTDNIDDIRQAVRDREDSADDRIREIERLVNKVHHQLMHLRNICYEKYTIFFTMLFFRQFIFLFIS